MVICRPGAKPSARQVPAPRVSVSAPLAPLSVKVSCGAPAMVAVVLVAVLARANVLVTKLAYLVEVLVAARVMSVALSTAPPPTVTLVLTVRSLKPATLRFQTRSRLLVALRLMLPRLAVRFTLLATATERVAASEMPVLALRLAFTAMSVALATATRALLESAPPKVTVLLSVLLPLTCKFAPKAGASPLSAMVSVVPRPFKVSEAVGALKLTVSELLLAKTINCVVPLYDSVMLLARPATPLKVRLATTLRSVIGSMPV